MNLEFLKTRQSQQDIEMDAEVDKSATIIQACVLFSSYIILINKDFKM